MFTPEQSLSALAAMKPRPRIYDKYGFVDAFNPTTGWVNPDVIGIDLGITLLSASNLASGNVWHWFMRNVEVQRGLRLAGLVKYRADYRAIARESLRVLATS
jgi:hypothetical protein